MASLNSFEFIFPIITVILSFLFFLSVTEQYLRKRKYHQLVWAFSMLLFMTTSGSEGLSLFLGYWDPLVYRIYYILASVQVAFMGTGALYLFASRNIVNAQNSGKMMILFGFIWSFFSLIFQFRAPVFFWIFLPAILITGIGILYTIQFYFRDKERAFQISGFQFSHIFILFTLYILILMIYTAFNADLNLEILLNAGGKEIAGMGWTNDLPGARATVRLFSPLNTVSGSLVLIGGAFYSYLSWQWSLKKSKGKFIPSLGMFNIYIGGGALILATAGTLSGFGVTITSLFGPSSFFVTLFGAGILYVSEAISIGLMYFGFLESDKITWQKLKLIFSLSMLRNKEGEYSINTSNTDKS